MAHAETETEADDHMMDDGPATTATATTAPPSAEEIRASAAAEWDRRMAINMPRLARRLIYYLVLGLALFLLFRWSYRTEAVHSMPVVGRVNETCGPSETTEFGRNVTLGLLAVATTCQRITVMAAGTLAAAIALPHPKHSLMVGSMLIALAWEVRHGVVLYTLGLCALDTLGLCGGGGGDDNVCAWLVDLDASCPHRGTLDMMLQWPPQFPGIPVQHTATSALVIMLCLLAIATVSAMAAVLCVLDAWGPRLRPRPQLPPQQQQQQAQGPEDGPAAAEPKKDL